MKRVLDAEPREILVIIVMQPPCLTEIKLLNLVVAALGSRD